MFLVAATDQVSLAVIGIIRRNIWSEAQVLNVHHELATMTPLKVAAQMPRTEPCRERLAVPARQLAVEPYLQILRRHPRSLLLRVEQARRYALENHVHRPARLGASVLVTETSYKAEDSKLRTADRLANLMAVFCILSWRVFWLTMLNRTAPDAAPTMALAAAEIELLD
jgi:hypothetical protein